MQAFLIGAVVLFGALERDIILPGEPFDYASQAFYPERWKEANFTGPMVPWIGDHVVFVTDAGIELDPEMMTKLVQHLDAGWALYRDLTGVTPRPFKVLDGKPTIVALPADHLSCGYGCGYVGATGIEMTRFYADHYPRLVKDPGAVPHAYFYEMGRNYYGFGARHDAFVTGFAVFMRYVCMDSLGLNDTDKRTAKVIRSAIDLWEDSEMSFVGGFTQFGGTGEKGARLFDGNGRAIQPTDQNVMYASLLLRLREKYGGDAFVKRFYRAVSSLPKVRARDERTARRQCLHLLVAASVAARVDLTETFVKRYRLTVSKKVQAALAAVDWAEDSLNAGRIAKDLP